LHFIFYTPPKINLTEKNYTAPAASRREACSIQQVK